MLFGYVSGAYLRVGDPHRTGGVSPHGPVERGTCSVNLEWFVPISRGDSLLLLVLCGEAPWASRILTLSTRPAAAARVRGVSPSAVCSSRVRSADADAVTGTPGENPHPHPPPLPLFSPCRTTRSTSVCARRATTCRGRRPLLSRSVKADRRAACCWRPQTSPAGRR